MNSSLYPLVASQALNELIGKNNPNFGEVAAKVIAIFLIGWALGGFLFGFLGDKIGRVKAFSLSILAYSLLTGLSAVAHSWEQLAFFRFLSGLGIGGEWALGVVLLAESTKPEKRIMSTAFLATGFSLGCCLAVIVNFLLSPFGWRWVFAFGALPALLVFYIVKNIEEPKAWVSTKEKISSPFEIFNKKYSYNLTVAFLLGLTFSIGSWTCIFFWLPIWLERILGTTLYQKTLVVFISNLTHSVGSFLSGPLLKTYKRRTILMLSYFFSFLTALFLYTYFKSYSLGVLIFASLLGFFFGIIPGSFAIYFPELFPTKIRSTAKGFCYSTARIFTAFGALYSGHLVQKFSGNIGQAAAVMSLTFLFGAMVSLFVPETDKDNLPL